MQIFKSEHGKPMSYGLLMLSSLGIIVVVSIIIVIIIIATSIIIIVVVVESTITVTTRIVDPASVPHAMPIVAHLAVIR